MRTNNIALRTCRHFQISELQIKEGVLLLHATLLRTKRANRPVLIGPRHVAVHQGAAEVSKASGLPKTVRTALITSLLRQLPYLEGNRTNASVLVPLLTLC